MKTLIPIVALAFAAAGAAQAQDGPVIYPAKGQSAAKQDKDRKECDRWAVKESGFDPAVAPPPAQKKGGVLRGALAGAAVGGIAGSLGGEAGGGAAVGGALGATAGGIRQSRQNAANRGAAQASYDSYSRAYGACLTGRGYTVK